MPIDQPSPDVPADPFAAFRHVIPVGAVPTGAIAVVEYIDPETNRAYCVVHTGDEPLSTFLGLFELGKARLIEHFEAGQGGDE